MKITKDYIKSPYSLAYTLQLMLLMVCSHEAKIFVSRRQGEPLD